MTTLTNTFFIIVDDILSDIIMMIKTGAISCWILQASHVHYHQ